MKKLFLIAFFTVLFSIWCYGAEDYILINQPDNEITFDDAKNINSGIMLLSDNIAETENYYDQLTEYEKIYYDDLEASIITLMDGTTTYIFKTDLTIDKKLSSSSDIWESVWDTLGVDVSTFIFRPIYALTYFDKPQYFWLDINNITANYGSESGLYYPGTGVLKDFYIKFNVKSGCDAYFPDCYTSGDEIRSDYDAMITKANEIVNSVPEGSTEWGKLNYYMNWFKDNCEYNQHLSDDTATKQAYLPTSALLYGKDGINAPVCEGYSEALKILCNMSGIKAMCTETFYTQSGSITGHKWNLINIGGKFYHCDPTWFDSYTSINSYRYFLTGSTSMSSYDTSQNHTINYQMSFHAPEISTTDYLNDFGIKGYSVLNIDNNTVINQTDTIILMRRLSGINSGTLNDVNGDGKNDINDAVIMQKLMFK